MTRLAMIGALLVIVAASCASAAKTTAVPTGGLSSVNPPSDGNPVDARKADTALPPPAAPPVPLARGRCNETFDCDDTCDLAPSGFRWDCERRKCVLKALPNLSPQPGATDVSPAAPAAGKAKVEKSVKQRT
jgi:hypothetical protein